MSCGDILLTIGFVKSLAFGSGG